MTWLQCALLGSLVYEFDMLLLLCLGFIMYSIIQWGVVFSDRFVGLKEYEFIETAE